MSLKEKEAVFKSDRHHHFLHRHFLHHRRRHDDRCSWQTTQYSVTPSFPCASSWLLVHQRCFQSKRRLHQCDDLLINSQ